MICDCDDGLMCFSTFCLVPGELHVVTVTAVSDKEEGGECSLL